RRIQIEDGRVFGGFGSEREDWAHRGSRVWMHTLSFWPVRARSEIASRAPGVNHRRGARINDDEKVSLNRAFTSSAARCARIAGAAAPTPCSACSSEAPAVAAASPQRGLP